MKTGLHMSASWPNSATLSNPKEKEKTLDIKVLAGQLNSTRHFLFACKNEMWMG